MANITDIPEYIKIPKTKTFTKLPFTTQLLSKIPAGSILYIQHRLTKGQYFIKYIDKIVKDNNNLYAIEHKSSKLSSEIFYRTLENFLNNYLIQNIFVDLKKLDYTLLTAKERAIIRQAFSEAQSHKCYYCKESLSNSPKQKVLDRPLDLSLFPPNFLKYPVHLDHDHYTNLCNGAVHAYCNGVMWQYEGR